MDGNVLVAILPNRRDLTLAWERHWYRIPLSSVTERLRERWPPEWLAFYQPRVFGDEAYSIRYYAQVQEIRTCRREELFPDEPRTRRSSRRYHQLLLAPIQSLRFPIYSRRRRRISFIPTTWEKFINAAEINDLYGGSPLEDRLWAEFQRFRIPAERRESVRLGGQQYALDFAIYCTNGRIAVETEEREPRATPGSRDDSRRAALVAEGWQVMRFSSAQIRDAAEHCIPAIVRSIEHLGGVQQPAAHSDPQPTVPPLDS